MDINLLSVRRGLQGLGLELWIMLIPCIVPILCVAFSFLISLVLLLLVTFIKNFTPVVLNLSLALIVVFVKFVPFLAQSVQLIVLTISPVFIPVPLLGFLFAVVDVLMNHWQIIGQVCWPMFHTRPKSQIVHHPAFTYYVLCIASEVFEKVLSGASPVQFS
nr:hypothetical protein BaRGS_015484 [Batillaria attramentaria]